MVQIRSVGVIGAGQMGTGIAHVVALGGYDVLLHDVSAERLEAGISLIEKNMSRQVVRGIITQEAMDTALKLIKPAPELQAIGHTDLAIEAAYLSGGTAAVNGSTTIDVAGATAAVSGSFTSSTSGVSVSLLGTGDLAPNGFDLGQVTVALAMTPTAEDVSLSGSLSLGGIFTVGLSSTVGVVGGQVGFYLTLDAGIAIPGIGIGGQLTLTNCTDDTCSTLTSFSAQVAGQFSDYSGAAYSFGQFAVSQDWSFQISASGYTNQCSGVVNTGANEWQSCFVGGYSVGLATWSPYLSFSAGFSINFEAANWQVNTSCSGSWYPSSWNCNTSSYFGGWYTIATVGVSVDSNGNMSASFDGVNLSVNV